MKKQFATSCSEVALHTMKRTCDSLRLSRNAFIETVAVLECFKRADGDLSECDMNILWDDFPSKSNCKITKEFLELQKTLSEQVKIEVLKLFYKANLLDKIRFSALKQANFYIKTNDKEKFLFYYGINNIKNINIETYIKGLEIRIATYGVDDRQDEEYIFLGRMQQYKHATKRSELFEEICERLNINDCDCIKVHYKKIDDIISVLESL